MKFGLYTLKDVKLNRFQPPFVARDDQEARIFILRAGFSKLVYDDLDLYKLGDFSDENGEFVSDSKRLGLLPLLRGVDNE